MAGSGIVGWGPSILTAKLYGKKASRSKVERRSNEARYITEVAAYLRKSGLSVTVTEMDNRTHVVGIYRDMEVKFSYQETHGHYICRTFSVVVGGKRSNIQAIRALVENPERWERAWQKRNARRCHAILMGNRGHTRDGMD